MRVFSATQSLCACAKSLVFAHGFLIAYTLVATENGLNPVGSVQSENEAREQYEKFVNHHYKRLPWFDAAISFDSLMQTKVDGIVESAYFWRELHLPNKHWCISVSEDKVLYDLELLEEGKVSKQVQQIAPVLDDLVFRELNIRNYAYIARLAPKVGGHSVIEVIEENTQPNRDPIRLREFLTVGNANIPIHELAKNERFKVVEFFDDEYANVRAKRVRVVRNMADREDDNQVIIFFLANDDGRLLGWSRSWSSEVQGIEEAADCDYVELQGKLVPHKFVRTNDKEGYQIIKVIRDFKFLNSSDTKDCFLTFYGLPEPGWYRPPPPYWLYVSIAGMILLVIGALLLRYRKRLWRKGSTK
ncbi:MAG TPA: hypothetical protein PKD64_06575 [Pirellulaceae bacterium]|nr:hypothetical protein [Pirellulaceae bacterium]HMO91847.1 hypothetical protein [Pirellulaceae bacterium]